MFRIVNKAISRNVLRNYTKLARFSTIVSSEEIPCCNKNLFENRPNMSSSQANQNQITYNVSNTTNGKRIYIKSFGCSHNMSDGEYMGGILLNGGYSIVDNKEEADLWIINTCTVRDKSISSFENIYKEVQQRHIPVIIAGCMTEANKQLRKKYKNNAVIGVTQIHKVKEIVDSVFASLQSSSSNRSNASNASSSSNSSSSSPSILISNDEMPPLNLPKVRRDPYIEIIPISLGCKGSCTFCQTKLARGNLRSYTINDIVMRVRYCIDHHIPEIWLTSEDTGAYGIDIGTNIINLLNEVNKEVKGSNTMIKIGMTNPPYLEPILPQLADILSSCNFYSYLHIPVQSGSDAVLKKMNRKYTVNEFKTITTYLQHHVPGMTVSTDIIVGFPYETDEDHAKTMQMLKELNLNIVHYSRYYARPHTVAAHYDQLPIHLVKQRVKELSDWFKGLQPYNWYVNKYMPVWVSNECIGGRRCCHTKEYTKVMVPDSDSYKNGDILLVKGKEATRFHIDAEVVDTLPSSLQQKVNPLQLICDKKEMVTKFF